MRKMSPEELVWLGSAIAIELAKGKSQDEIRELKALLSQVLSSLITLLHS